MNDKRRNILFIFSLIILLMTVSYATAADKALTSSDITYIGAFRLPSGNYGCSDDTACSFHYAGWEEPLGITYNPANSSLILAGHGYHQYLAEVIIPIPINSSNLSALNTATVRQNFTDVSRGYDKFYSQDTTLGGLLVYNRKLIVSATTFYAPDSSQIQWTHITNSNPSNMAAGTYGGHYTVFNTANGGLPVSFVDTYMANVPDNSGAGGTNWQTALGGPVLAGAMSPNIVGRTSEGPAAFTFDPNNFGANSTPHSILMYYGEWNNHPYPGSGFMTQNNFWNGSTHITGVVFPAGTKTVLYFGDTGTGYVCYKTGDDGNCNSIRSSDSARPPGNWDIHAQPYRFQIWAVNANDLLAVKNGTKNPWDINPQIWPISTPLDTAEHYLSGAAYDPSTQRVYVTEGAGDGDMPLVLVFQINATGVSGTAAVPSTPQSAKVKLLTP